MARRRHQAPKPVRRGAWWTILVWKDQVVKGQHARRRERVKLGPASMPVREAQRLADEHLRPINQGLESIGSAVNFRDFVESIYKPVLLPTMAKTTQERSLGVIKNYLYPAFEEQSLSELTKMAVQRYISSFADAALERESKDKIRDVLSSILGAAVDYGYLVKNPVDGVRLPAEKRGKRTIKPRITPEQFLMLIAEIPEPYATMVFVAVLTALRVSELIALRWCCLGEDSITIVERCSRGDWGEPKSESSNATIGVDPSVIARMQALKSMTIKVKAGHATRRYKAVKADGPNDLVFQSVQDGKPMRDNNILVRYIKPAGRKIGLPFVNWLCLRRSYATWMIEAGANPKDVQAQMRHAKIGPTMDIYAQFVPESQRRAVNKMMAMVKARQAEQPAAMPGLASTMVQ